MEIQVRLNEIQGHMDKVKGLLYGEKSYAKICFLVYFHPTIDFIFTVKLTNMSHTLINIDTCNVCIVGFVRIQS